MGKEVLAIFQIGPVQEYISVAKKTQDFWSGSYLLSYLNCVAIDTVIQRSGGGSDVIIYPALTGQNLFRYVSGIRASGTKPWSKKPTPDELRPTIPNRFVARLDAGNAIALLDEASQSVQTAFREIAAQVRSELLKKIQGRVSGFDRAVWDKIWDRQTKDPFEIYWITHPLDLTQYQQSYTEAEALFGARKAIRNFQHQDPEPGYKCTLCGQREPLHAQPNGSLVRGQLKTFWEQFRTVTGHRFREGEHLCAVCTTKRLAPDYVFRRDHDIPSTSSVSVANFVCDLVEKYKANPKAFQDGGIDLVEKFVQKAGVVAPQALLDFAVEPLPRVDTLSGGTPPLSNVVKLDGDWFIEETYDNLIVRPPKGSNINTSDVNNAKDALSGLVTRVKEIARASDSVGSEPAKYYALFRMDGDDMGKHIERAQSIADHRQLSQALCDFSLRNAPAAVETSHLGKVIYFGGDEGVAFVSLQDLLPAIDGCRKDFGTALSGQNATACIGAVIAHHQQALLQVLREVRGTVERAKELKDVDGRKDGFCIGIMKRSGGITYARAHWEYDGFQVIPILQELIDHYRYGRLSDKWWHQLSSEEWALKQVSHGSILCNVDLARLEAARLITRHADEEKMKNIGPTALDDLIARIQDLLYHVHNWEDFMGLMEVAAYIARGGGR